MSTSRWFASLVAAVLAMLLLAPPSSAAAQEGEITGEVVEEGTGIPLEGVQVSIPGTGIGTLTGADGTYTLLGVPAGEATVEVNLLGYAEAGATVTVAADETVELDFELASEPLGLDDVVVTGQAGAARAREIGNVVSRLNMAEIDEPVGNMDELLQGRVTAMTVNPGSGTMGSGAAIRLRGNVSISTSNQPLIYIDGVRQGADDYPLNRSSGAGFWQSPQTTTSPLNDLNPDDIERIEVVKGAAATTIYGSEAAAGVIQIFTRRGQEGDAQWTYRTNQRFDRLQSFGSDERPYGNLKQGARATEDGGFGWGQELIQTGWTQQHNLSVRGGSDMVQYFISGQFEDGEGVHVGTDRDRVAVRGNTTIRPWDELTIDWNTSYSSDEMNVTHTGNNLFGVEFNAFRAPGSTVPADRIPELLDARILQENTRLNTGVSASWVPRPYLSQEVTVGLDRMEAEMSHDTPFGYILESAGSLSEQRWVNESVTLEYIGSLEFGITDDIGSRLSWGGQNVTRTERMLDGWGERFPGPGNHTLDAAASRLSFSSGERIIDAGVFAESRFDYRDRLFLTTGLRVDGNSTFGDDLGLEAYPKASASWVISDEDFFPEWGDVRLRAAYGHAGRAPGPFDAVRTWQAFSFGDESAFVPQNVGNPELGPERTEEIEAGFETSLLGGRLQVDFNHYWQTTSDALLAVGQVPSSGFTGSQLENVGEISNRGLELEVHSTPYQSPRLTWDLGFNVSTNRSRVEDTAGETFFSIVEDQPVPVVRGNRITNPNEFADPEVEEDAFYGPNQPTRIVGLNTSITLPRGIRLTSRAEYQGGHYISQASQWNMVNRGAGGFGCDHVYDIVPHGGYAEASQGEIDQLTALERGRCYNENLQSGFWVEPADFLKLRELTLNVPVPVERVLPAARSSNLTFSARNIRLWTHSDFSALDPEMVWSRAGLTALTTAIGEEIPSPMQFTVSAQVNF